jgi:hypothetical protein
MSTSQHKLLKSLYYNPETGFGSAKQLPNRARPIDKTLTIKITQYFVSSLPTVQKTKQVRYRRGEGGHFRTFSQGGLLQGDLIDMQKIKKFNKGYSWILIVVDIFSRKIFAEPSRTKGGQDVTQAFAPIADAYKKDGFKMIMLVTDSGNEFSNSNFQGAMDRNGTLHRTVELGDHKAMGVVDRAIRTLREKLQKQFVAFGTKKWVDVLPGLVKNMNSTINQGVGSKPNDIWDGKIAPSSHWDDVFAAADDAKPDTKRYNRFKIGDHVRVKKQTTVFTKKSQTKGFTKNIFYSR